MELKSVVICSFLLSIFSLILFLPSEGNAQFYPYRITGLIELEYFDYSTILTSNGVKTESSSSGFMQHYVLGIVGYIKTPKLVTYSVNVGFRNSAITNTGSGEDTQIHERDIDYSLSMNFLSERPVSLDVYASRSTGTLTDGGSFDTSTNTYGLALKVSLKDILKKKGRDGGGEGLVGDLPLVIFRYDHYDFNFENILGRSSTDIYSLDMRGSVRPINTRYLLGYEIVDFSNPGSSEETQTLRSNTNTAFKGNKYLSTSFLYTSGDNTKVMLAIADLSLNPVGRFSQDYSYQYYGYETGTSRSDSHDFTAGWSYLFSNRFHSRAGAYYSLTTTDGESEDTYGSTATLTYNTPVKDFDFSSDYNFSYRHTSQLGELMENVFDLGLKTRKLSWGMISANYGFTYEMVSSEINSMENVFTVGIQGNVPRRAYWIVQGSYVNSTSSLGTAAPPAGIESLTTAVTTGTGETSYYVLIAEAGYPLGKKGGIYFQSSYTNGTADSAPIKTLYYEARLNYRLLRNLSLFARWRQESERSENFFNTRVTEYEGRLYYRLRRLYLSVEYTSWRTIDPGPTTTEVRTIFLRLTRPI